MSKFAFVFLTAAVSFLGLSAESTAGQTTQSDASKQSPLERVGGFVYDMKKVEGKFVFINAQKSVDASRQLSSAVDMVRSECNWHVTCESAAPVKPLNAEKVLGEFGATAGVFLVSDPILPALAAFPEQKSAFVNVLALQEDKPSAEKLSARIDKELRRAFVLALGGGYSSVGVGAMVPAVGLAGLDAIRSSLLTPDVMMGALRAGQTLGFKPIRRTTYLKACKEGWAPTPTNDIQRAVWDKVHQAPTAPIVIKPEPAKK